MTTLNSISNLSIQFQTTRLLRAGREELFGLQAQIASGKKTNDLSTLGASNTRKLLDARSGQTKYESYIQVIQTVQARVKVQASALAGMQNVAAQMNTLINNNQTQAAALSAGADSQVRSYLLEIETYLNQQVEGRYIFAGNRYATQPSRALNSLPVPPTESYPFTPATSPTLPIYDNDRMSELQGTSIVADEGDSTLTLGSSTWAAQGYQAGDRITLNGVRGIADGTTFTIQTLNGAEATVTPAPNYDGTPFTEADATSIAGVGGDLVLGSNSWAALGVQVGDTITVTNAGSGNGTYTITNLSAGTAQVSPAAAVFSADNDFDVAVRYTNPDIVFSALRNDATSGAGAYDQDSLYIDDGFLMQYGATATQPGVQNLIMGLRWAYAATQDSANYETYMTRASELVGTAVGQLRVMEADAAADQGVLANTLKTHKNTIVDFKNQASNVIDADVNEAATQLSILSAQIEASYAATGRVIQLSIINYI